MEGTIPSEMGTLSNLSTYETILARPRAWTYWASTISFLRFLVCIGQLLLENIGLTGIIPTELGNLSSLGTCETNQCPCSFVVSFDSNIRPT